MSNDQQVIATRDLVVHNDVIGIDQKVFAGQPVPPDLVEAYKAAGGDTADPVPGEGVASQTVIVRDELLGIDRKVIAGQPVPADLVDAYDKAIGGSGETDESADGSADDSDAAYDPGEYTVEEVLAHLADHPDEVKAVKQAEAGGKDRAGIRDYEPSVPDGEED